MDAVYWRRSGQRRWARAWRRGKPHFRYAYYYTGLRLEPESPYQTGKPYLLAAAEVGYVSAEGRGRLKIGSLTLYKNKQAIRDWLFSGSLGAGWAIPLDSDWSLRLSGQYSMHAYRPEEYNGWSVMASLRYEIR